MVFRAPEDALLAHKPIVPGLPPEGWHQVNADRHPVAQSHQDSEQKGPAAGVKRQDVTAAKDSLAAVAGQWLPSLLQERAPFHRADC